MIPKLSANELLLALNPLLQSNNIDDLLNAKEALHAASESMKGADRERIAEEIGRVMAHIGELLDF
jgi:hypothetical protein